MPRDGEGRKQNSDAYSYDSMHNRQKAAIKFRSVDSLVVLHRSDPIKIDGIYDSQNEEERGANVGKQEDPREPRQDDKGVAQVDKEEGLPQRLHDIL